MDGGAGGLQSRGKRLSMLACDPKGGKKTLGNPAEVRGDHTPQATCSLGLNGSRGSWTLKRGCSNFTFRCFESSGF